MKTLVLANQKGGVGKSAIACQLAYYLTERSAKVLFLEFDHQLNSSKALLKSGKGAQAPFIIVPGDLDLQGLERQPTAHNAFVNALKAFLDRNAERFDICIIDTNPNPDIRYASALVNATYVLSPIQLNQEAIDGIGALLNHSRYGIRKIKAALNPGIDFIGVLPNMVEPTPFQRSNLEQVVKGFHQLLIPVAIEPTKYALLAKRSIVAEA
jgi:chromosome partitioning protein